MSIGVFQDAIGWGGQVFLVACLFVLIFLLPARVVQKRHGYSPWLLFFGVVPYLGPLMMMWAFAIVAPKQPAEGTQ